tara:strand:+ start:1019 stop:1819 length:801 start_codon:yes stop_codon:yes gene_type:complete
MIRHATGANKGKLNQDVLQVKGTWTLGDAHPVHIGVYYVWWKKTKQIWGTSESVSKAKAKRERARIDKKERPEHYARLQRQWRLDNPAKVRETNARSRVQRKANGKTRAYKRRYARLNPQIISESNRRAREKRKANGKSRAYWSKPSVRMIMSLRQRLYGMVKHGRDCSSLELFGTTREGIKRHLESQFTDGMTWDNYGYDGWHIDHVLPCASFDLTDPRQQRICFNYQNLRPLWAFDNRSKSAKIPWSIVRALIYYKHTTITNHE